LLEIKEKTKEKNIQEEDEIEVEEEIDELDYKIYKVEKLIERRELLLNNCLLR